MKAVQLSRFGGPDVLDVVELPSPVPGPGEVLVRIQAAGVNFFETLLRQDRYAVTPELPTVLGVEAAGVVEAHGPGASSPAIGTRVAVPLFAAGRAAGGYAEYLTIGADAVVPLPERLSPESATALLVQGLTALHLVRRSPPAGKTVLVTAAAGGVGSLLVQLAASAGASRVVAAASSQEKRDLACALGADAAVDYTLPGWTGTLREATGGAGPDIIYDLVGGRLTKDCVAALAPLGELVFGALGRFSLDPADIEAMLFENQSLKGLALLPLLTPDSLARDLADLFARTTSGHLKVIEGARYPLDEVAEAHRLLDSRSATGKVVLIP